MAAGPTGKDGQRQTPAKAGQQAGWVVRGSRNLGAWPASRSPDARRAASRRRLMLPIASTAAVLASRSRRSSPPTYARSQRGHRAWRSTVRPELLDLAPACSSGSSAPRPRPRPSTPTSPGRRSSAPRRPGPGWIRPPSTAWRRPAPAGWAARLDVRRAGRAGDRPARRGRGAVRRARACAAGVAVDTDPAGRPGHWGLADQPGRGRRARAGRAGCAACGPPPRAPPCSPCCSSPRWPATRTCSPGIPLPESST